MPSRKEIQWSQLRVGALVLSAMAILVGLILLMSGQSGGLFERKLILRAYFENAAGLKDGAPVTLEGVTIGNVVHVRVVSDRNPTPVEVVMRVGDEFVPKLHVDSTASIAQAGVLGDSFVDITSAHASGPRPANNAELRASGSPSIQDVVRNSNESIIETNKLLHKLETTVDAVNSRHGAVGELINDPELGRKIAQTLGAGPGNAVVGVGLEAEGGWPDMAHSRAAPNPVNKEAPARGCSSVVGSVEHTPFDVIAHAAKIVDHFLEALTQMLRVRLPERFEAALGHVAEPPSMADARRPRHQAVSPRNAPGIAGAAPRSAMRVGRWKCSPPRQGAWLSFPSRLIKWIRLLPKWLATSAANTPGLHHSQSPTTITGFRRVEVIAESKGLGKLTVCTRTGYFPSVRTPRQTAADAR